MSSTSNFAIGLISGSAAGFCVDIMLFPLDTIKTRLQSAPGFFKSGGFNGIYRGLGSVAVGSVPGAGLFFTTYEVVKSLTPAEAHQRVQSMGHMAAACCGETVACLVRVPTEVVKQRAMTSRNLSSFGVFIGTVQSEGFFGLYRGYVVTWSREIPFSLIQFPLWEYLKSGTDLARGNLFNALFAIYREKGIHGLYAGLVPRTLWISLGGCIFLGVYDAVRQMLTETLLLPT